MLVAPCIRKCKYHRAKDCPYKVITDCPDYVAFQQQQAVEQKKLVNDVRYGDYVRETTSRIKRMH